MASMVSGLDRAKHLLRTAVMLAATSCSARLLWLEMSMMMTRRPFRTDGKQLKQITSHTQVAMEMH